MTHVVTSPSAHGQLTAPATLTIERLLPGPIERVWAYLTDADLRKQWLADGAMTPQAGSSFELVWRNDSLSASPGERPQGFSEEGRATCRLTVFEPPHRLRFEWPGCGEVTWDLQAEGDAVRFTVTHRQLPDRDKTLMVGAGWHMHLDILVARSEGRPPPSFWQGWVRLREVYAQRLPSSAFGLG
jgi:uncharacterized protein YndB with AHSA1/START domain